MFFPVFLISIAVIVVLLILYARQLGGLFSYCQRHDLPIFGQRYDSVLTLAADGHFLNELFVSKKIHETQDRGLRTHLRSTQNLLRAQVALGIIVFLAVLVLAFQNKI